MLFTQEKKQIKIAPITQSLIGILKNKDLDKIDYQKHLEEKYL